MNRVSLAVSWRTIKEESLLDRQAQGGQARAVTHELHHISVNEIESLPRQDDLVAGDLADPVHHDPQALS